MEESRQKGWEAALAARQEVAGGTRGWEPSLGTARSNLHHLPLLWHFSLLMAIKNLSLNPSGQHIEVEEGEP